MQRCEWVPATDQLYVQYHDNEWGVPVHEDRRLFEFLILEGAQAGLSWRTILYKRENFRKAFDRFAAERIANYDENKIKELLSDEGIIRNKLKIYSVVKNARSYMKVISEYGSFDSYIWGFVGSKQIDNKRVSVSQIPSRTEISDKMSKDLKKRGFSFVGTTICYSFMQAVGLVNDHTTACFRHKQISKK